MNLKDIASISGKSGLYLVVKPTRTGVILETIDQQKNKIIANANNRVSLLKEISIYTNGKESSKPLENIFQLIFDKFAQALPVDAKSSPQDLSAFLEKVLPDYDKEKVYTSDIKKLVSWYATLIQYFPERFTEPTTPAAEQVSAVTETKTEEKTEEEVVVKKAKPKKATAKKAE